MKLLLDTNALIWTIEQNPKLGKRAQSLIERHGNDVMFSIVSIWELLIKTRTGKLHLDWQIVSAGASEAGLIQIGVDLTHMEALNALPYYHGDPFDHLILAQAITEGATLVTSDQNMMHYGVPIIECG
ncbi:MAG: type II toxin-antitoxin system VapC family toxin [Chakrabartia sp.]